MTSKRLTPFSRRKRAVAAGAMLTMIVDTMIPEAVAETQDWAGLVAVVGLLLRQAKSRRGGECKMDQ